MFTGLIETTGTFLGAVRNGRAGKLRVEAHKKLEHLAPGESIAVNGACLTLEKAAGALLAFHVLEETFRKTNLGRVKRGAALNLERALAPGGRLGGHLVSGHVDGAVRVISLGRHGDDMVLTAACPPELRKFIVPKGSVALNGVSLTVAELGEDRFAVHLIPATWRGTNLSEAAAGDMLNLECDMLGKYVASLLERGAPETAKSSITMDTLTNAGFTVH